MKAKYHREITVQALSSYFRVEVLEPIISANLGQDALRYQFGYDHFHYDNNSFGKGDSYCEDLRHEIIIELKRANGLAAQQSFGRLTHTVQDFYAHSNFVVLWREFFPDATPQVIDPDFQAILRSPNLCSGKLYYPIELFSFVSSLRPYILPLLPHDSHAWMNLDDPTQFNFEFAFAAAVKKTELECQRILRQLSPGESVLFTGK